MNNQETNVSADAQKQTELKKQRHEEKFKSGKTKLLMGVILLMVSFVFSCVNFHADAPFAVVMYSFTTIGTALLFWGLYDVLN